MKILFHKTAATDFAEKLQETLTSIIVNQPVCVTQDTGSFLKALLNYRINYPIVVIYLNSIADAIKIESFSDILDGLFLIIATENIDDRLLMRCRQLYPGLLTYYKEDLSIIAAMIEKRLKAIDASTR
ncbi:hypothetical protein [Desulfosarcina ovata]|uniref:Response regulatory domain-containing protein n=1 Tax=Desulfosarcina ovata subsp. ovata TaxID=2752305 RepID=A0A5K8A931_9BACT|nr:hypothetical protein [Desulfosarcina ovata]BBO89037.1 hypothetical protein DSCOOX_22170 [Desulfosarcina ovata subsp. ovata]